MHPDDVADLYDVGRSTVYNWRKEYQEKGPAALKVKNAPGRTPRLTDEQRDRLRKLVVGRDPRQLQFEFALWTRQMVRELIKREFGVDYTPEAVGNILHDLGLSPQRPLTRAYQQDPERVRRWKEEEYPAIRKAAKAAGGTILFCDEAGIRTDYHSGTTWAPVGQTPVGYTIHTRILPRSGSGLYCRYYPVRYFCLGTWVPIKLIHLLRRVAPSLADQIRDLTQATLPADDPMMVQVDSHELRMHAALISYG